MLVASHGDPSPLDGWRDYICLACGRELQPHRFRPILYLFLVLAAVTIPFMLALGVWLVVKWYYRYMVVPFVVAAGAIQTVRYVLRVSRRPVTRKLDTAALPRDRVRLTEVDLAVPDGVTVDPGLVAGLTEYAAGVIRVAGECLEPDGQRYWASVRVAISPIGREATLGYRGAPDPQRLEKLFAELERLPVVAVPKGSVHIEFWFRVG